MLKWIERSYARSRDSPGFKPNGRRLAFIWLINCGQYLRQDIVHNYWEGCCYCHWSITKDKSLLSAYIRRIDFSAFILIYL